MRRILSLLIPALAFIPSRAEVHRLLLTGGMSSAGATAGLKYSPDESYRFGVRAAYLPGVHAFDVHFHFSPAGVNFPSYFGTEIIYLYDTVVLTDKEFRRFEWVAIQGVISQEFRLRPRLGLALEGGAGIRLWSNTRFVGGGAPIDIPVSVIARAELLFGI